MTQRLNRFDLQKLRTGLLPFKLHYFPTVGSTHDHSLKLRDQGRLFAPSVVLTSKQTKGRGRGQSKWHSPPGVLTVTFCVSAPEQMPPQLVPLVAGLCVADTARLLSAASVKIKWPNDCWHFDEMGIARKLAGILCERRGGMDFIGIGLNVNLDPKKLTAATRTPVTSIAKIAAPMSMPVRMTDALLALARAVDARLIRGDAPTPQRTIKECSDLDALRGKRVVVNDISGVACGIDAVGRLLVKDDRGTVHRIISGTVHLA